jgi:hypothetical protein
MAHRVFIERSLLGKGCLGLKFSQVEVRQFLLANTVYDLLAIDKVGEGHSPNVNKFQYHKPLFREVESAGTGLWLLVAHPGLYAPANARGMAGNKNPCDPQLTLIRRNENGHIDTACPDRSP